MALFRSQKKKSLSQNPNAILRTVKGIGKANRDLPAGIPMRAKNETGMPKIPLNR